MIVVRVELWSAVTGERTELARMHISNTGEGGVNLADYRGETFVGRSAQALDRGQVCTRGVVARYPRNSLHVWNLAARMLGSMGYSGGRT